MRKLLAVICDDVNYGKLEVIRGGGYCHIAYAPETSTR